MRHRRNTYKRKTRKQRRTNKRKQHRFFSRKQRKMRGGGIPNDNIVKGLRDSDIVAPGQRREVESDGFGPAPTMIPYEDYKKDIEENP